MKFIISSYYNCVIRLDDVKVPSKRVGYKNENGILIAKVPTGSREFEAEVRKQFSSRQGLHWPYTGRLLLVLGISMSHKEFKTTDVDNVAKTILDAFKGILYEDDAEIVSLFINKAVGPKNHLIALRQLNLDEKAWIVPPMLERVDDENRV